MHQRTNSTNNETDLKQIKMQMLFQEPQIQPFSAHRLQTPLNAKR